MKHRWLCPAPLLIALAACSEEAPAPQEPETAQQGGEASGDVEGGTISDAMIPLETLTSQSPPLRQQTTTTVTTRDDEGGSQVTIETTTVTTNGEVLAPTPTPPEPPARPRG